MRALDVTTAQRGCLAFYYHCRSRGGVSEHRHDAHQISITVGRPLGVRWWSASRGEEQFTAADGNIIVNPAQEPHRGKWDGAWESIGFYVDRSVTDTVARDLGARTGDDVVSSCRGRDPATYALAQSVLQEVEADPLACRLYAESLANVLAVRLLLGHLRTRLAGDKAPQPLSVAVLRRVESFVADNLERNLSVSEIAAVTRLSTYHFSRRFRAGTGMSPYQYVTRQRVERARQLLANRDLSIAEVSCQAGFSSQSHLSTQFLRIVGSTPKRYREQL